MKITAIVQARMGSTRLPGKVLKIICGRSVLEHIINNLLKSQYINNIIIATTDDKKDDIIESFIKNYNVVVFRGSEKDVLSRYYNAAKINNIKNIVRITGDDPVIDCNILDECIEKFFDDKLDYFRRIEGLPLGMGFEIFTFDALSIAYFNAKNDYEREHVTPYLYDLNNNFKILSYKDSKNYSKYRVTLDTQEDFEVINALYENIYKEKGYFLLKDVIDFLDRNPQISKINEDIEQKKSGE
jgi:spore coat polysaccharide biosynthesis protein SpsF